MFTALLILGTQVSARVNNWFTITKVAIVLFVIVVGLGYMQPANFTPFIPPSLPTEGGSADVWSQSLFAWATGAEPARYGVAGVLSGAALVFFAFIGFDVVATSAEEVKDPQRTLPLGIFGGLALVTVLYMLVAVALTGMVPYTLLAQAENPSLATAFIAVGADWAAQVISVGILVGLTTVIMVLLLGLSRVMLAMSRDGLLPRWLSVTSATRRTPVRLQLICGTVVALPEGDWKQELCVVVRPGTWGRSLWRINRQGDNRVTGQIGVATYADANCTGAGTVAGPLTGVGSVAFDRSGSTATLTAFWGLWTQPSGLTSRAVWARKGSRLCIFGDQIPTAFPTAVSVESYVDTVLPNKTCYTQN